MEALFKFIFFVAVLLFCLVIVGVFLLIVKIVLLSNPEFIFMGVQFSLPQ